MDGSINRARLCFNAGRILWSTWKLQCRLAACAVTILRQSVIRSQIHSAKGSPPRQHCCLAPAKRCTDLLRRVGGMTGGFGQLFKSLKTVHMSLKESSSVQDLPIGGCHSESSSQESLSGIRSKCDASLLRIWVGWAITHCSAAIVHS